MNLRRHILNLFRRQFSEAVLTGINKQDDQVQIYARLKGNAPNQVAKEVSKFVHDRTVVVVDIDTEEQSDRVCPDLFRKKELLSMDSAQKAELILEGSEPKAFFEQNISDDPREGALQAYADVNELSDGPRVLDWVSSEPVNPGEWADIMMDALENSNGKYNRFDASIVGRILNDYPVSVYPAREGSVAAYIKMERNLDSFSELVADLATEGEADELSIRSDVHGEHILRFKPRSITGSDDVEWQLNQSTDVDADITNTILRVWWD